MSKEQYSWVLGTLFLVAVVINAVLLQNGYYRG